MAIDDCLAALSGPERVHFAQTHAVYQRRGSPLGDVRQIKLLFGNVRDVRARQSFLHQILRDHPQLDFVKTRALIEQTFKSNGDRAEALYGWFLLARARIDGQTFAQLTRLLRELAKTGGGIFGAYAETKFVLPDLITLYLEKLDQLDRAGVLELTKLYPDRGDEIWAHHLVRLKFLNLDQLPHTFSKTGYLRFLLALIETKPSTVATSIDELV